uniref:Uncharacterized protein n=1 Tax=Trichogramma kaykai TaxID=54128 RepID=A0ABD2WC95_9HYME
MQDIFSRVEIDWLLTKDVKNSRKSLRREVPIIDWAIRTGYKDEPNGDKNGKPWSHGTTPVHHAASSFYLWPCDECKNADAVRDYLKIVDSLFQIYDRFDVNYTDESGFTHLHAACKSGNYEVVKRFLENGQDPNCMALKENDETPLHAAVDWGHKKITELLLRKGANPNAVNAKEMTPLHIISMRRVDDDLAEVFLDTCEEINSKVNVKAKDKSFNTPLHLAMLWRNKNTFETILKYGGNPNWVNMNKETLLHLICKDRRNCNADFKKELEVENLVRILFKTYHDIGKKVLVNAQDRKGNTPLHEALGNFSSSIVKLLLRKGANPNIVNLEKLTPLHIVSMKCNDDSLPLVIFKNMRPKLRPLQVDAQDESGNTPLHVAIVKNRAKLVESLLKIGSDPCVVNAEGLTPLHIACESDYFDGHAIDEFFELISPDRHRVRVDVRDKFGNTPLHVAIVKNRAKLVESLLKVGSDPCVVNAEGLTPLHIACESDYFDGHAIDEFFELISPDRHRVRVDVRDKFGNTPLHVAFDKKHEKMVVNLLKLGFDPYATNVEGVTPVQIACKNGYFGTVWIDEFSKLSAIHEAQHVDAPDESGKTPLRNTLDSLVDALLSNRLRDYHRFKDALVFLLNQGADPNFANKNKETLLHLICKNGGNLNADDEKKLELANLVRMLLFETRHDIRKKVLVNAQNKWGNTPLHEALNNCMSSTVEVLLRGGANPNIANLEKLTPLHFLCIKPDDIMFTFTLFEAFCHNKYHPLQVNAQDKYDDTPLHFALGKKCPHLAASERPASSSPSLSSSSSSSSSTSSVAARSAKAAAARPRQKSSSGGGSGTWRLVITLTQSQPQRAEVQRAWEEAVEELAHSDVELAFVEARAFVPPQLKPEDTSYPTALLQKWCAELKLGRTLVSFVIGGGPAGRFLITASAGMRLPTVWMPLTHKDFIKQCTRSLLYPRVYGVFGKISADVRAAHLLQRSSPSSGEG